MGFPAQGRTKRGNREGTSILILEGLSPVVQQEGETIPELVAIPTPDYESIPKAVFLLSSTLALWCKVTELQVPTLPCPSTQRSPHSLCRIYTVPCRKQKSEPEVSRHLTCAPVNFLCTVQGTINSVETSRDHAGPLPNWSTNWNCGLVLEAKPHC